MERINRLLNTRERCISEIEERLARAGFSEEEIEDAVQAALRVNLINEERYAHAVIRGKSALGWGRAKIMQKLQRDGIPASVIAACEEDFPSSQHEYDRAMHEVKKRGARSKNPYATYVRRLVARGYSFELSKRVAADYLARIS